MIKRIFHLCVFMLVPLLPMNLLHAQDIQIPEDYKFDTQDEFTKAEPLIIKCADYLESAPMNDAQRKAVNTFFFRWLSGSAHVNATVNPYVLKLADKNKDFLMVYLSGWARFILQHPEDKTELDFHTAGVRSVLKAYQQCKGVAQEDLLEELIGRDKDGTLQEWITSNLPTK